MPKVYLVASGKLGIAALHATALEPELFASHTLRDKPPGWANVLAIPVPKEHLVSVVHGVLPVMICRIWSARFRRAS